MNHSFSCNCYIKSEHISTDLPIAAAVNDEPSINFVDNLKATISTLLGELKTDQILIK